MTLSLRTGASMFIVPRGRLGGGGRGDRPKATVRPGDRGSGDVPVSQLSPCTVSLIITVPVPSSRAVPLSLLSLHPCVLAVPLSPGMTVPVSQSPKDL